MSQREVYWSIKSNIRFNLTSSSSLFGLSLTIASSITRKQLIIDFWTQFNYKNKMGKKTAANATLSASQPDDIAKFKIAANLKVLQRQDSSVLGACTRGRLGPVYIAPCETSAFILILRGDGILSNCSVTTTLCFKIRRSSIIYMHVLAPLCTSQPIFNPRYPSQI